MKWVIIDSSKIDFIETFFYFLVGSHWVGWFHNIKFFFPVRSLLGANEDELSVVGQAKQPNNEVGEVSSLVKPKKERNVGKGKEVLVESPSKQKKITD